MSKKKNTLLRNTSILMAATIISRVIGLLYRSPLGETIGNEGLGYYSTASNLYTILLLISSYSIPMAVSKIVSERLALKEYRNAHRVFHGALIYAVIVGGIAALVAFFGGKFLLPYNQQNALLALRVLAPTIFFSAVLGVLRGYFQAHSTMMPTSISQIIEQIFNAAFSIGAAWFFIQQFATNDTERAKFGAAGGTLGTGAGVLAGLCFMLLVYGVNRKSILRKAAKDTRHREESYREIFQVLFLMVTPVIFTTFIYNCNAYLDNYLFFTILGWHGENQKALNAAYGEFSNYYVTLINVPLALARRGTGGEHARHHIGAHMAGTRNKQFGRIRPSQPLDTERSGGTGAKSSDGRGIEQRQRLARRVVAQQRGAKDLGQPLFGILREPSSELETEEAASRQLARADIHIGHAGFELLIYHRPRNTLARCLLAICLLNGSDCILNRQHLGNFLGRKHHHLPHHRSSQRKLYVASLYGLATMPPRIIFCWNLQRFLI